MVSSRQQADGSRRYLTQMFFFRGFYCLLPAACFSPIKLSKGDRNRFLEAKESRLRSTEITETQSGSPGTGSGNICHLGKGIGLGLNLTRGAKPDLQLAHRVQTKNLQRRKL